MMKNILIIVLLTCFITGCMTFSPVMRVDPQIAEVNRIAIFPFENASGEERAGKKMTSVFLAAVHNGGFVEVVEHGDIEKFLIRNRIRSTGMISTPSANRLRDDLGCDAVLVGTVNEFAMTTSGRNKQHPSIGVSMRLISTKDGRILWAISHSRHGADNEGAFGMGRVESLSELSDIVAEDVLRFFRSAVTGKYKPPKKARRKIRPGTEVVAAANGAAANSNGNGNGHTLTEEEKERERQHIRSETKKMFEQIGGE